ncbi:hypothetical protein Ga0100231_002480 [Opitutaceae bacterium TAV4]|nr:hypothetical protein Ga0100231_002480 [Opitutaceae bacterium TAV4]RRK01809.1 hypothetical protein Ga0100230_000620 [Opitutaceae bacterium TAV3]
MNKPRIQKNTLAVLGMAGFLLGASPHASAQLLIEENFNYTSGGNLYNNNGGTGFSGTWQHAVSSGTNYDTRATIVDGLTFAGLQTSAQALQISSLSTGATISTSRTVNVTTPTATGTQVWGSFLFQNVTTPAAYNAHGGGAGTSWLLRFRDDPAGANTSKFNTYMYYAGDASRAGPAVAAKDTTLGATSTAGAFYDNQTYLFVTCLTVISSTSQRLDLWVLDAAGLASARADGLTVTSFDNYALLGGKRTVTSTSSLTPIASGDNLVLVNYGWSGSGGSTSTFIIDELRYGLSAESVLPTAVPEPKTAALWLSGVSAVLILGLRIRKSRSSAQR